MRHNQLVTCWHPHPVSRVLANVQWPVPSVSFQLKGMFGIPFSNSTSKLKEPHHQVVDAARRCGRGRDVIHGPPLFLKQSGEAMFQSTWNAGDVVALAISQAI